MDMLLIGIAGFACVVGVGLLLTILTGGLKLTVFEESEDGRVHWRENGKRYSAQLDGGDKQRH